jgi:Leucine-rich repeat (LRR) protein
MNATTITIDGLSLNCIEPGVFWPLNAIVRGKITRVNIKNNPLEFLPKNTLNAFPGLNYLVLSKNMLKYFPSGFFAELKSVKTLHIDENSLTQMPDISGLSLLTYVNVGYNKISAIPVQYLTNSLNHLIFYDNELTQWPEAQNIPGLLRFQATNNVNMGDAPVGFFSGLTNLNSIFLQKCSLTMMPAISNSLYKVIALYLTNNRISTIPNNYFSGMTDLKTLDISFNSLTNIPNTFSGLVSLSSIQLSGNSGLLTTTQYDTMRSSGYFSVLTGPLILRLTSLGMSLSPGQRNNLQNSLSSTNSVTIFF